MPKPHSEWKVLPYGPITQVADRVLTVEGDIPMPLGKFPRRMSVVGLSRNRSAIFSAMALGDEDMRRVEAIGKPAFLIVPNGHHRLDAPAWKRRYPKIKVLCPPGAKDRVGEVVPVGATRDVLSDKDVDFVVVDGTAEGEAALIVRRPKGTFLLVNDAIANVRHPKGLGAKIMARLFGFGVKRPQIPRVFKRAMVKDHAKLAAQLGDWSELASLRALIPSHGDILKQPAAELARLAAELR